MPAEAKSSELIQLTIDGQQVSVAPGNDNLGSGERPGLRHPGTLPL